MKTLKQILMEQPDSDANNNGYPDKTEDTFFEDFQRDMRMLELPHLNNLERVGEMIEAHDNHIRQLRSIWNLKRREMGLDK